MAQDKKNQPSLKKTLALARFKKVYRKKLQERKEALLKAKATPSPETKKETDEGVGGKNMNSSTYKINTETGKFKHGTHGLAS